jgi:hypothetical protein
VSFETGTASAPNILLNKITLAGGVLEVLGGGLTIGLVLRRIAGSTVTSKQLGGHSGRVNFNEIMAKFVVDFRLPFLRSTFR